MTVPPEGPAVVPEESGSSYVGRRVILLGPQRQPTLRDVARSVGLDGPVATVTAGWREREPDDGELDELLGGRSVNLQLHARWQDVFERDPEYAAADRRLRQVLDDTQELYLLRLGAALRAIADLQRGPGSAALRAATVAEAVAQVADLDAAHLVRVAAINAEFYDAWPPHDRTVIAHHRDRVERRLADAAGLVVAGGRVDALISTLHLFNVAAALDGAEPDAPVIAWSAGAMALAERIVLFHDHAVRGPGEPEVWAQGLSLLRAILPLPHATARLDLLDRPRMATVAARFAPARCLLLDPGARVDLGRDGVLPTGARVLGADGVVDVLAAA